MFLNVFAGVKADISSIWEIREVIGSVLLTIFGAWLSYREKAKDNRASNKPNTFNSWGFRLIILGVIGTLYSGWNDNNTKKEALTQAKVAQRKEDSVNGLLITRSDSIEHLNIQLVGKSESLASAQDKMIDLQNNQLGQAKVIIRTQNRIMLIQSDQLDTAREILGKSLEGIHLQDSTIDKQVEIFRQSTGGENKPQIAAGAALLAPNDTSYYVYFNFYSTSKYPVVGIGGTVNAQKFSAFNLLPKGHETFYSERTPIAKFKDYPVYVVEVYWAKGYYDAIVRFDPSSMNPGQGMAYKIEYRGADGRLLPFDYFANDQ